MAISASWVSFFMCFLQCKGTFFGGSGFLLLEFVICNLELGGIIGQWDFITGICNW
jgi:hypothetical protein